MPELALNKLKQTDFAKILLSHRDAGVFVGYRQEEFVIGGQAEFGNPFASAMEDQSVRLNAVASELRDLTDLPIPTINLKTKAQTRAQWVSSGRPQIPVTITLVRGSMRDASVSQLASKLASMCMPRSPDGSSGERDLLETPGRYKAADGSGTWTVQIGNFFKADKLNLLTAQLSLSPQSVSDGSPVYGTVACTFEPYMIVTEQEFRAWFLK